jgi:deoxyribodipyrimidine photolyase-related protein
MKKYYDNINKYYKVKYFEFDTINTLFYKNIKNATVFQPYDHKLTDKLNRYISNLTIISNPNFLFTLDEIKETKKYYYKNNRYNHDNFYKLQRKRLDILMKNNKPVGGKWSYDTMNRKSLPNNIKVNTIPKKLNNSYIKEAIRYVDKHFNNNYGSLEHFIYPIDRTGAIKHFKHFLKNKLKNYGSYQDAVNTNFPFMYHSIISPFLNIGLITDRDIVDISKKYYNMNKSKIPINNYEGFIRQVIGWRNYAYCIYMLDGKKMYNMNYMKHKNKISDKLWEGKTGMVPIDSIINNINKYAYAHHIERLMYLGNYLLICMCDPKEVHRIFMEWTIDSYDWVMTPNVMGMSQYADKGMMMTRLYFSSSNYIVKMSNFKKSKDNEWWKTWDALYYNFINKHYDILKKNYATSRQANHWKKKSTEDKKEILLIAKKYLFKNRI